MEWYTRRCSFVERRICYQTLTIFGQCVRGSVVEVVDHRNVLRQRFVRRSTRRDLTSSGSKKRRHLHPFTMYSNFDPPPPSLHVTEKISWPTTKMHSAASQDQRQSNNAAAPNLGRDARQLLLWAVKYTRKHFNDKLRE